jgi:DNA-binding NtrC family response regulator
LKGYDMDRHHIAIVDDDNEMRNMLVDYFRGKNHDVDAFPTALEALEWFSRTEPPELIISDIRMPQMDGLEFTRRVREKFPDVPIILITAFGSIESAIEAIKRGAFDYVTKPFKLAALEVVIARAFHFQSLKKENKILRAEIHKNKINPTELIGKSAPMREIFDLIQRVSPSMANILITGESGTGKEVIARSIHNLSSRSTSPFITINCTAIPEGILENELFGYAKSVNGHVTPRKGLLEEAQDGTLFLDEVGDLDMTIQAKLLRILQEKQFKTLDTEQTKDFNVRIIAATHKDLRQSIRNGTFREDLYYRLAVVPVNIPPLRFRTEDIPLLAQHFLEKYSHSNGFPIKKISTEAYQKLNAHRWEGNARELENMMERIVVLSRGPLIEASDIQLMDPSDTERFFGKAIEDSPTIETLEKRYIQYVLNKTGGKKEKASQILGINRRTLYRKEREYGFVEIDETMEALGNDK